jgi:hypothetical protein
MTPKSPSKQRVAPAIDLYAFAGEHLFYEAQMFTLAYVMQPSGDLREFLMNLRIEVCVLHLRNLIEFFYPSSNPRPDDVLAADYVADWDAKRPAITPLLEKARYRAGKELHHLTSQRIDGHEDHKAWGFATINEDLRAVIKVFVGLKPNIPSNTISELLKI